MAQRAGFQKVGHYFFLGPAAALGGTGWLVYLALRSRGAACYPTISTLQTETGLARATLIDALKKLEAIGAISIRRDGGKKSQYQVLEPGEWFNFHTSSISIPVQFPTKTSSISDTTGSISEPHYKDKEEPLRRTNKKNNCGGAQRARATRLPEDWQLPSDWADWARKARPDLDPVVVGEIFRDCWIAKPGKDGLKLNWRATWRNFVRTQRAIPVGLKRDPTEAERQSAAMKQRADEHIAVKQREEKARKEAEREEAIKQTKAWMAKQPEEVVKAVWADAEAVFEGVKVPRVALEYEAMKIGYQRMCESRKAA